MKKILILLATVTCLLVTSCMSFKATDLAVLHQDSSMQMLGHFEKEVVINEFLGDSGGLNLGDFSADAMNDEITRVVWDEINKKGGNGAININIEYTATALDIIFNSLTSGIWAPAHLKITGDVINYNSAILGDLDTEKSIAVAMASLD